MLRLFESEDKGVGPAAPALSDFPVAFGQWKLFHEDPIAADAAAELRADRLLSQTYMRTATGSFASLFVAWFQTQRGGARQPHSPKVCFPAWGWTPEVMDGLTLDTAGRRHHGQPLCRHLPRATRRGSLLVSDAATRDRRRVGGKTLSGGRRIPGQAHRYGTGSGDGMVGRRNGRGGNNRREWLRA